MSVYDTQIRVQELSGVWTTIGSGNAAGITLSDGSAGSDQWGSRECSFTLKRNPRAIWPDIGAFTPVEVEVGGVLVWTGRVKETPTRDGDDRQMTVSCEGWQFHLDDDVYQRAYVHANITEWQDVRSHAGANLGVAEYAAQGVVATETGGILYIGTPNGGAITAGQRVGVYLDLGPNCLAYGVSFDYTSSANTANDYLYVRGSVLATFGGVADATNGYSDALAGLVNTGHAGSRVNARFGAPKRYVCIFNYTTPGYTPGADVWWRISALRISTTAGYLSLASLAAGASDANAAPEGDSLLVASTIVADAITQATLLLSSDVTKIATSSFYIPDFSLSGNTTPREVINAANVYENYQPRVLVDKRLEYRQRPIDAGTIAFQVDEDSGAVFEDASANSGENIYSAVVVEATGADGLPLVVNRGQPVTDYIISAIQPTNPGAEVNTTGWSDTGTGTFARTTTAGQFTAGVAGFRETLSYYLYVSTSSWTGGSFVPGQTYRLTFSARKSTSGGTFGAVIGVSGVVLASTYVAQDDTFHSASLTWTQPSTVSPVFVIQGWDAFGSFSAYWDDLILYEGAGTIVQKRKFKRTFVLNTNMNLTTDAAQQIGDKFLTQHVTTPLKGSLSVSGSRGVKRALGGNGVAPYELLLNTGEQMLFPHLTNPDNGAVGRTGVIDSVTYNLMTGEASVSIDNTRSNFDALLSRLAIVTGQVR